MNFAEVTILPADVKKDWLRATLKEIKKKNQQSDLYNEQPREWRSNDTMYECIQVKYPI